MYSDEEIDLIATYYYRVCYLDIFIRVCLDTLTSLPLDNWLNMQQERLRRYKSSYHRLAEDFDKLPETVQTYPLLAEAKKSLDDKVMLLHL